MNLYNLRMVERGKFQLAKFDTDFNVEAIYNLVPRGFSFTCNCPANARSVVTKPCKHKRMLPLMLGAVNTDRFYDPEKGQWHQPFGDLTRPKAGDLSGREALPDAVVGEAVGSPTEDEAEPLTVASFIELPEGANVAEEFGKLLQPEPPPLPPKPTMLIRRR